LAAECGVAAVVIVGVEPDGELVAASPEFVDYVNGWGAPKSRKRIVKIRDSIRAFAQIRRSTKADYSGALADWDSDLAWLKAKYQV
jgi:hypothetical protein